MYYKVLKGTETFEKLNNVWDKIVDYNNQSKELTEELGFEKFGRNNNGVGGGISCFKSEEKKEGYRMVGKKHQDLCFPKANQKNILAKIDALPVVSYDEYNKTIGFESQFTDVYYISHFASKRLDELIVIKLSENCKYQPKEDMIEITTSEFKSYYGDES